MTRDQIQQEIEACFKIEGFNPDSYASANLYQMSVILNNWSRDDDDNPFWFTTLNEDSDGDVTCYCFSYVYELGENIMFGPLENISSYGIADTLYEYRERLLSIREKIN